MDPSPTANATSNETPKNNRSHHRRRRPKPKQDPEDNSTKDQPERIPRPRQRAPKKKPKTPAETNPTETSTSKATEVETKSSEHTDEDEEELCFICTEPIVTYAVSACDHRTCHLCAVRLRALYKMRQCAYCKAEQKTVIFTKDPEKPFEAYTREDTPFFDKKLGGRFEDQQTYQDTSLLLQYNCPEPDCKVACENGWGELKKHVKKAHELQLCDLCTRNKKIFSHEHTLYTYSQLQKHHKQGDKGLAKDDDTGFKGHPECYFCRTSFYDNDELYTHCRDKHEQCHLCVRRGVQHEYFANYDSMEKHFKKEHYICQYRECLDKKFVVFESDIDLKAHEVEEHGASVAHLPRAKQIEARRVDVDFDYGSNSSGSRQDRQPRERAQRNQRPQTEVLAPPSLTDFPSISGLAQALPSIDGSHRQTGSGKQRMTQRSAGFRNLAGESNWPTLGESSTSSAATPTAEVEKPNMGHVSSQAAFLDKVGHMLRSMDKVVRFKQLTAAYRNSNMDADSFVSEIRELCDDPKHCKTIFSSLEEFLDSEEKRREVARAWRNRNGADDNTPKFQGSVSSSNNSESSSRVLVIKSANTRVGGTRTTKSRTGVWNRVAHAAENTEQSFPALNLPTLPNGQSKTAWANQSQTTEESSNSFPALSQPKNHFPTLPTSSRRSLGNSLRPYVRQSAWADGSPDQANDDFSMTEDSDTPIEQKKKKGKKKQVLFRVGL
ncbi:hypothetical protein J3Q64DRAFT_1830903 [Phycomyces blakesleeanus]|uniref:RING-type E3 ubiquitin transferase n=1 Tax=Phycomyces blakesleeanus TaxID=4837 RepID=A0ABR3B8S5_PHYBL